MESQILEGTREKIIALLKKPESAGRKLKLRVLLEDEPPTESLSQSDKDHFYFTVSPEGFEQTLDMLAEMNQGLPILPPEAFERESIYEVNGLSCGYNIETRRILCHDPQHKISPPLVHACRTSKHEPFEVMPYANIRGLLFSPSANATASSQDIFRPASQREVKAVSSKALCRMVRY